METQTSPPQVQFHRNFKKLIGGTLDKTFCYQLHQKTGFYITPQTARNHYYGTCRPSWECLAAYSVFFNQSVHDLMFTDLYAKTELSHG